MAGRPPANGSTIRCRGIGAATSRRSARIGLDGIRTGLSVPGAIDGDTMLFFVEELLVPTLKRGDIVVMDNNPIHKLDEIEDAIEAAGAWVLFLPTVFAGSEPHRKLLVESESPAAFAQAPHLARLTRCVSRRLCVDHPARHSRVVSALWLSGRIHLKIAISSFTARTAGRGESPHRSPGLSSNRISTHVESNSPSSVSLEINRIYYVATSSI